jgi:hypothetical protein
VTVPALDSAPGRGERAGDVDSFGSVLDATSVFLDQLTSIEPVALARRSASAS